MRACRLRPCLLARSARHLASSVPASALFAFRSSPLVTFLPTGNVLPLPRPVLALHLRGDAHIAQRIVDGYELLRACRAISQEFRTNTDDLAESPGSNSLLWPPKFPYPHSAWIPAWPTAQAHTYGAPSSVMVFSHPCSTRYILPTTTLC